MPAVVNLKLQKRGIVDRYARPENARWLLQAATTIAPIAALWVLATLDVEYGFVLKALVTLVMSLFLLRIFALMHDCGHGCIFRSPMLNAVFGFCFGVLSGMPQFVWAQHHNYHHATNGNWAKYRGPMAILSVDEYEALSPRQQRNYARVRNIWLAPIAGFVYLILNPRLNWLKGMADVGWRLLRAKRARPGTPLRTLASGIETRAWASADEFRHMTLNNLVLLGAWALMSWLIGPLLFFSIYLVSVSLAGGAGIVLFTVQHNFEHAYASGDQGWDYDTAAIDGTSYLVLPRWLNWFTADIGYHHVHHISARIPNYRLAACHAEYPQLFGTVKRLTLADITASLKFVLWDTQARRLISVDELNAVRQAAAAAVPA